MVSKKGHLILPWAFPDKGTPAIDSSVKVIVQCDVPVVKILW